MDAQTFNNAWQYQEIEVEAPTDQEFRLKQASALLVRWLVHLWEDDQRKVLDDSDIR